MLIDNVDGALNAMIMPGYDRSSRSFSIKDIVQEILKWNDGVGTVLIMAASGKTALNAGAVVPLLQFIYIRF